MNKKTAAIRIAAAVALLIALAVGIWFLLRGCDSSAPSDSASITTVATPPTLGEITKAPNTTTSGLDTDEQPSASTTAPETTETPVTEPDPQTCSHNYGAWQTTTEATFTEEGAKARTCSLCQHTETEVIALAKHNFGSWKTTTAATCVTAGSQSHTCSACGKSESSTIKAT